MKDLDKKIKIIFLAGFLVSLHLALTSYINSSFLAHFLGEERVGLVYSVASIASILGLLLMPKILRFLGGHKFLLFTVFFNICSLLSLSLIKNPAAIIGVFIFYLTLNNLIIFCLDELLQIFSSSNKVGIIRGFYLTSVNLAWVLAQLFSSRVLTDSNFSLLYLISFGIMIIFFALAFIGLRKIPDPEYDTLPATDSIKEFFRNKNLARSYKINFILAFFFSWMVIYTPIYLSLHLGFSWHQIATIFTIMLLPFVLIEIPAGNYSDKVGERKMLMLGFFVISLATLALFFITRNEVWVWALALFMTRVGAAIIEIMNDVYFFKHIKKENDEYIGIYRNAGPMAYIVGPLVASALFLVLPSFNYIYLVLGAITLFGILLSSQIKLDDI